MAGQHVVETSSWEPWQRDYRFGVICSGADVSVRLDVERLRQFDAETQTALKPLVDHTEAKRREQIEAFRENGLQVRIVEMQQPVDAGHRPVR